MLNLLIKPASSLCNMRCKYCFYHDESAHRDVAFRGVMSEATASALIEKAFAYERESVLFAFQGGEPTLAGLDFFRFFTEKARKSNPGGVAVTYTLQTNGLLIDAEWARFLRDNGFLVGLSFDGHEKVHNALRPDALRRPTYGRVLKAAKTLARHGVDFNILTVVTPEVARNISSVYAEMKRRNFRYLQFIPCLGPLDDAQAEYALSNDDYLYFLKTLFTLWYEDFLRNDYYSVRYFDNLYFLYLGEGAEQCGMQGRCNLQYVVEGDGAVYPCDFYCLDEYLLGNVNEQGFGELRRSENAKRFLSNSAGFSKECLSCRCFKLCRSGCRRYKRDGKYAYCEAFRAFYEELAEKLPKIKEKLLSSRPNGFHV